MAHTSILRVAMPFRNIFQNYISMLTYQKKCSLIEK
jgi:hypothetical protein